MNVNIVDNLAFQKKTFPDIYKSYEIIQERTVNVQMQYKLGADFFYLLVGEDICICTLISEVFHAELFVDRPFDSCIINYGIEDKISSKNGIVYFEINHPYLDSCFSIYISKFMEDNFLERAYAFYTYQSKPLKQLQMMRVKKYFEYSYEKYNIVSREGLLESIKMAAPEYVLRLEKKCVNRNEKFELINPTEKVSLRIIKIMNDCWNDQKNEMIRLCEEEIIQAFKLRAKEILSNYLIPGEFEYNFIYIVEYFLALEKLKKQINNYFEKRIIPSVRRIKESFKDYADMHNSLSRDAGIIGLDHYVEEELVKLIEILEEI